MKIYTKLFICLLAFSKGNAETEPTGETSGPDIVSGHDAKPEEFPYLVSMQLKTEHICGGTILNENYILTAAHCTKRYSKRDLPDLSVVAGTIDLKKPLQRRNVSEIRQHKKYNPWNENLNDISILKLGKPLEFNSKIQPVILAKANTRIPAGSRVELSGWGSLGGADNLKPTTLQTVTIYVANQDYCVKILKGDYSLKVFPTNVCAFNRKKRAGMCKGDSGGPLMMNKQQIGISSWSKNDPYCGSKKYPGIFTRVPNYIDWINEHIA